MNHSMINAMVSMQAVQQKLDVLAHNISNVNTAGYKRRDASFQDILTSVSNQPAGFQRAGRLTPLGLPQGWGAKVGQIELDMEQGALRSTGNPFDLGMEGNGLFEVVTDGVDADGNPIVAWTRDGSFKLSPIEGNPAEFYLTTQDGYRVRGADDQPIVLPADAEITFGEDGAVRARDKANPEAVHETIGQLKLMRAVRPQVLMNVGSNLFGLPPGMAADAADEVIVGLDGTNRADVQTKISVRQGFLEQSNVNLTEEMTELMSLQRAYQMNAKAITSSDTMMGLANQLRG